MHFAVHCNMLGRDTITKAAMRFTLALMALGFASMVCAAPASADETGDPPIGTAPNGNTHLYE